MEEPEALEAIIAPPEPPSERKGCDWHINWSGQDHAWSYVYPAFSDIGDKNAARHPPPSPFVVPDRGWTWHENFSHRLKRFYWVKVPDSELETLINYLQSCDGRRFADAGGPPFFLERLLRRRTYHHLDIAEKWDGDKLKSVAPSKRNKYRRELLAVRKFKKSS